MDEITFSTRGLIFSYSPSTAFSFPDVGLQSGEQLLVTGESGIGKTTFLHLAAGLLKPESGAITICGLDISALSHKKLDRFRGKNIGIIYQRPHFVKSLNLKENLLLAQLLSGNKQDQNKVKKTLEILGLGDKLHKKTSTLSQGEQQRASIARAVINRPALILADEPTSSLDDKNTEIVAELLREQAQQAEANLIIITHDNRLKSRFQNHLAL